LNYKGSTSLEAEQKAAVWVYKGILGKGRIDIVVREGRKA
jgi:hypothetical protein